jgi:hypothetical protein
MIETIYVLGVAAAILVNIAALTLLVVRYIPFPATARAAGIIALCLALFSLEHFVGLGRLYPLFVPLTALSLFVIWCERAWFSDETFRTSEIVFLCALLYGAVWRLSFPEIVEDNDRLTDFHFVANYLAGTKLPPVDYWLPYQRLDYYYTFQHYSAALLGRIFGLGPGASFTLASIILPALVLGLAWEFLTLLRVRLGGKLLSLAALAIGGTGLSPLLHVIKTAPSADFLSYTSAVDALIFNSRFLGYFDNSVASATWQSALGDVPHSVRLPVETFGYQYAIGGYHAVLSGFLLQFLALTVMAAIPRSSQAVRARLDFILGLTVPLALCSHAWVFPLQAALVGAWTLWDRRNSGEWHLLSVGAGAAAGVVLLLPFLAGLGTASGHMQMALVTAEAHAPIVQFLMVWWPLLVLVLAVPIAGVTRSFAGFLAVFFLALLIFAEFFNAPDGTYRDDFLRFNPALKWWGWIFTGGVFSLSAALLAGTSRVGRIVAASVLVLISVFAIDAGRYLVFRSHAFAGEIDGKGFYAQDRGNGRMLSYLTDAPPGIVLENIYDEFPRDTGIYGSFAQKPNLVGLPYVLEVWKKDLPELPPLVAKIESFYAGTLLDAARFLTDHDVRYVVWSIRESKNVEAWQSIMQAIDADYRWMEFSATPEAHIGLWIRR